jgi:hypothetical protein
VRSGPDNSGGPGGPDMGRDRGPDMGPDIGPDMGRDIGPEMGGASVRSAFLSGGGQSGPAGHDATRTGLSECGLRPWATNRSILVAPGNSTRAETSSAWPPVTSTQQTCWLRT